MAMIHLTIVTPEGKFFDDDAQRVMVRTTSGDVAILPHHIDYSAALTELGQARVTEADGRVRSGEVQGGLLHVSNDNVQVITNHFRWMDE
jgi:F-type H+-transporting ATPase subunit epsilon